MANRLQQSRQGIAVGGVATAADVQGPGRVGGDELEQDPFGRGGGRRSEVVTAFGQSGERAPVPGVREEEVDEARPGDLNPLEAAGAAKVSLELVAQALGYRAGIVSKRRRQEHRRVGAVVA